MDFQDLIVNGVNFIAIVFGLVESSKKFGLSGHVLTALSMGIGVVLGVGYQLAQKYQAFGEWYGIILFGLAVGLAASGVYDFLNARIPKAEG